MIDYIELKKFIKESILEYFSPSITPLFKITSAKYFVEENQQIEDNQTIIANIQGLEKAKQLMQREVNNTLARYKFDYPNVKLAVISDTEQIIFFTDDGDEYYITFNIEAQTKVSPKFQSKYTIMSPSALLAENQKWLNRSWINYYHYPNRIRDEKHPLTDFYTNALRSLQLLTEVEDDIIYYFPDSHDAFDPIGECSLREEAEFMDNLTQEFFNDLRNHENQPDYCYADKIEAFINNHLEDHYM